MNVKLLLTAATGILSISLSAQTPDFSIAGIKIGSPMNQVASRLPGYEVKDFPGRIEFLIAEKGMSDSLTIAGIDGRVAYISRWLYVRSADAVSLKTYNAELEQKFGHQSSGAHHDGDPRRGTWEFDLSGHVMPYQDRGCVTSDDNSLKIIPPLHKGVVFPDDPGYRMIQDHRFGIPVKAMNDYATNPACGMGVLVELNRVGNKTPPEGVDTFYFSMMDPQPWAAFVVAESNKQKQKERDQNKPLDGKKGPPM